MAEQGFDSVDHLAAWTYRALNGRVPYPVLKRLGIATPRRRGEFFALDRLLRTMPAIPGAVLECGVYQGATLLGMAHLLGLRGANARVFGLDSFEGFPEPSAEDALDGGYPEDVRKGYFADAHYDRLVAKIRMLGWSDRITLVKGFFENTLSQLADERFSLVHLDCDLYAPHVTCLEFVYPRMLPGSCIVFDEYASPEYPGAAKAIDEFFAGKPETVERLPDLPQQGAEGHRLGVRHFVRIRRPA